MALDVKVLWDILKWEWTKLIYFMQSCSMQQENELPARNIMEIFSYLCGPANKMHMFR